MDGPVLVIAGAGSGKTRVIEHRVLHLVQNRVEPQTILLLTFTRKAAGQMLERAGNLDPRCKDVDGGTFHSFCYKILKRYAPVIGFPNSFSILDETDAGGLIHTCCVKKGFFKEEEREGFPRKDSLRAILSMAVNKDISIEDVLEREYPHFLEFARDIEKLGSVYAECKREKNYMDYDDLLKYACQLLQNEEIRPRISHKYRYIMVDEYQDTNTLQGDISYLLAREHKNIMVVGDDAQSIYGFRGTSHKNIMSFPERFPGCRIIKLEDNYRSTQAILDIGNLALRDMKHKYSKCLRSAKMVKGEKPRLLFFQDAYREAEWIAERIKQLQYEGINLRQEAVLFRSAYISIPLQAELTRRGIPFQVFGGLKFYETAHVKDITAHLRIAAYPADELAWQRALMLLRGIGQKTAARIAQEAGAFQEPIGQVLHKYGEGNKYSSEITRMCRALDAARRAEGSPVRQFGLLFEYYQPLLQAKFDDWPVRANDLRTMGQIAARYSAMEDLLADFAIELPETAAVSDRQDAGMLTLSTIHSAKGLEWDTVFLIGLMEGVMPVSFALDDEESIEEEHRLFYVGVTRARSRLFLSLHYEGNRGGGFQVNQISRFVNSPPMLAKLEYEAVAGGEMFDLDEDDVIAGEGL